jgi:triosephosphate isomerase
MRKPVLAGNWKMYKMIAEAVSLVGELRASLDAAPVSREVIVAPPFTALSAVAQALRGSGIQVAGQTMHFEKEGAFTGENSPAMLKDAGASHVILGHSERRQLFGETDDGVGKKARAAFDHALTPIVCVGETLAEREAGRMFEVVERQLERGLRALSPDEAAVAIVAYEPVWAIGTGKTATPAQAQEVHSFIRKHVSASHGAPVAAALRILYGGSVKPDNVDGLMAESDIDGALVGGACLKADSFLRIVRFN